ncbi:MerR family transcriptional regulator [Massilia sp.]|uniref:MerR family transcriptional regulator n=1 Tax=Massilia sp. TaxID=1882437 RepID=UPI0028AEDF17|nr:MerR family transcriptional regulator [Massilia sp.]
MPAIMNAPSPLSIAAVERETRLSKDVLRVWEKRYGFPTPERDANGERCYPREQVERLRLMKRLMDQGLRPGRLARLPAGELAALLARAPAAPGRDAGQENAPLDDLLATLERDPATLQDALQQHLVRQGLDRFVEDIAAPLTAAVGTGWQEGRFDVADEHFYTEVMTRVLRQAIAALPAAGRAPKILLTTLAGETHGLGLMMAEALLALDDASCISLGTDTPLPSILRAAAMHEADIVALSFSAAYPRRQLAASLQELRALLPPQVALWAGGAGIGGLAPIDNLVLLPTLDSGRQALARWRDGAS